MRRQSLTAGLAPLMPPAQIVAFFLQNPMVRPIKAAVWGREGCRWGHRTTRRRRSSRPPAEEDRLERLTRLSRRGSPAASGFLGRQVTVLRCPHCLEVPSRALQSAVLVRTPGISSGSHRLRKSHDLTGTALDVPRVSLSEPVVGRAAAQLDYMTADGCSISIASPSSVSNGGEQRHVRGQQSER
jgi:hypothetical protein